MLMSNCCEVLYVFECFVNQISNYAIYTDISRQPFFLFGCLLWSSQKVLEENCLNLILYAYYCQVKRLLS